MFKALAIAAALLLPMSANADQNENQNPGIPYSENKYSIVPSPNETVVVTLGSTKLREINSRHESGYLKNLYPSDDLNDARYSEIINIEARRVAQSICASRLGYPDTTTPKGSKVVSVRCPRSDGGIECLLDVHH